MYRDELTMMIYMCKYYIQIHKFTSENMQIANYSDIQVHGNYEQFTN